MSSPRVRRRWFTLAALGLAGALVAAGCSGASNDSEKSLPPTPTVGTTFATLPLPSTVAPTKAAPATTRATVPPTTARPTVAPSSAPTTPTTARTVLALSATTVGLSTIGADPDQSVQYITQVLGAPTSDSGWVDAATSPFGFCAGKDARGVRWGDLLLLYGDLAAADGVRHFFGYTFGTPGQSASGVPVGVRTDTGISLGSTVADVRAAYPAAAITDGSPATFELADAKFGGIISNISQAGVVEQIYGGDGCS